MITRRALLAVGLISISPSTFRRRALSQSASPNASASSPSPTGGLGNTRDSVLKRWNVDPVTAFDFVYGEQFQDISYTTVDGTYELSFVFKLSPDEVVRPDDRLVYLMISRSDYRPIQQYQDLVDDLLPLDAQQRGQAGENEFGAIRRLFTSESLADTFPLFVHEGESFESGTIWVDYWTDGDSTVEMIEMALYDPSA